MEDKITNFPYLHGFSELEQNRLRKQARFAEQLIYRDIDFAESRNLLEVGCGVGAQSEILLRRFPELKLTGIDRSEAQLHAANHYLSGTPYCDNRFELKQMDATKMDFDNNSFDSAFLCWVLEHIPDPLRCLSEVRRVLAPGARVFVTEVLNSSFFLDPYSPSLWKYWMAFNDYQYDTGGDPFIGAKLGNMLTSLGYRQVHTTVKTWHLDNRQPGLRKNIIEFWCELLFSAAEQLVAANYVTEEIVVNMKKEFDAAANDPNAVFFYSLIQASARVE